MAQADHLLILHRNRIDAATLTASSELTPARRLTEMRPGRVWRAAGPSAWLVIDHGDVVARSHWGVVGHDLLPGDTIRLRTGDDPLLAAADATVAAADVDVTLEAWEPVDGFGHDGWGVSLGGYPDISEFNDYRPYKIHAWPEGMENRYTRVDIQRHLGAAPINVGCMFDGTGVQFSRNLRYGWSWTWQDPSEVTETEASVVIRARRNYRLLRMDTGHLPTEEAMGALDDLARIIGRRRAVWVQVFPRAGEVAGYRTMVYGIRAETAPIVHAAAGLFTSSLSVREIPE